MSNQGTEWITIPNGRIGVEIDTGAVSEIRLDEPETVFVQQTSRKGLVRIAVPLEHYPSHYLETGVHGRPELSRHGDEIVLHYSSLESEEGSFPIQVEIRLRSADEGLVISARVQNNWSEPLPQIIFPQLMELEAVGGQEETRLQLGRHRATPFQELTMRPDNAAWLERALQSYIPFADFWFNMKWLDYGDEHRGLTLFSRNTRHTTQGIFMQRVDRFTDRMHVRWMHYPFVEPGETWESGEYVLLVHSGDWYAGARAYQKFTSEHYPYHAPQRIREALGVRSLWPAVRNAPPNFPITALPEFAEEIADPDLGITELILWHWWLKNGYPIFFDTRLGTEEEFRAALQQCREMGVPIVLFVSHHILRDTEETDPDWVHLNAGNQPVGNNWTYGRDFLPTFRLPFSGTHAMIEGSALSPGWRETGLESYKEALELGGSGICFDVFRSWADPDFNPARDGRRDEEGEKLLDFARQARKLIHAANPDGSFSAEHVSDVNVPVLDYTWEWTNSYQIAEAAPFRYVFPQFRLNANVNEHPRGAVLGFMEGALLNIIPGNMRSYRLRDYPALVALLKQLAALRRQFLHYFTDGQYRFREGLTVDGGDARVYTHNDTVLVIAANPSDNVANVTITVDPIVWGSDLGSGTLTRYDLAGKEVERTAGVRGSLQCKVQLDSDTLQIFEYNPDD